MTERVGLHLGDESSVIFTPPAENLQFADASGTWSRLAIGGPVVKTKNGGRRLVHEVYIKVLVNPQREMSCAWIAIADGIGHTVFVAPEHRRIACIEPGWGRHNAVDVDRLAHQD